MRLDIFLRNSRLIKRRTLAQTACRNSRITVNGRLAKPATEVQTGDEITIVSPTWRMRFKVLSIPTRPHTDGVVEILEQEKVD